MSDTEGWPLRWLNWFAIPTAIALAAFAESFRWSLVVAFGVGLAAATVMAILFIAKLRHSIKTANPLRRLSAEVQGVTAPSLQIRFVFMQSLSGGLIGVMWCAIAFAIAYPFR